MQFKRYMRRLVDTLRVTSGIQRLRSVGEGDVATTFLRWRYMRGVFHRGYVLTSGLYFVLNAHLSASQLVFLGTVMSVTLVL